MGKVGISGNAGLAGSIAAGSKSTEYSGGLDGHVNANRLFKFGDEQQRIILGAYADYSRVDTTFDALSPGTAKRDRYSAGARLGWFFNTAYLQVTGGGLWGSGSLTNGDLSAGQFSTRGHEVQAAIGNVFTLLDHRTYSNPRLVAKAPRSVVGGYDVKLDLALTLTNYGEERKGFVDTSGFINGAEKVSSWTVGGRAKLYANVVDGRNVWTPYVSLIVEQLVDYRHTIDVVAQTGVAGGFENFAAPGRTYAGTQFGFSVRDSYGINYGLDFSYLSSAQTDSYGVRGSVRVPLTRWLGLNG